MEAESDEKTEPETQRDGWRLRKRGQREPPEFRVKATHMAKQNRSPWDSHSIMGSVVFHG